MPITRYVNGRAYLVFDTESQAFNYALTMPTLNDIGPLGNRGFVCIDLGPVTSSHPMPLGSKRPYIERA
jgi:hypothetical protein